MFWREAYQRFLGWYESSLANRVVLRGILLAVAVLVSLSALFYPMISGYLAEASAFRVQAAAQLLGRGLQADLNRSIRELSRLADQTGPLNPQTALVEYRRTMPDLLRLEILHPGPLTASAQSIQNPSVQLETGEQPLLRIQLPLARGGAALLAQLDLAGAFKRVIAESQLPEGLQLNLRLENMTGRPVVVRNVFSGPAVHPVRLELTGQLADLGAPLVLLASMDQATAEDPLIRMAGLLILFALLTLWVVLLMSWRVSTADVSPLREMSHRAMEIASGGPSRLRELPVERRDEIGWMGMAFNEMVFSLRQAYAVQDQEVKRRTHELAEARERLSSVLAGIDDMIYSTTPDFLRFEYVSPASQQVLGLPAEIFMRRGGLLESRVEPADLPLLHAARARLGDESVQEVRYRIRHVDGRLRTVNDRMHIVFDATGRPARVSGMIRDVTASVEAEFLLHLRERALASSSCGVVISDMRQPGQPVIYANEHFENMTGYSTDEIIGRNCRFLQAEDDLQQPQIAEIREAIAEGRGCKVVLRNHRKDGEAFWNELLLSPLRDEQGVVTHYIGIQNDITASMLATQALVESESRLALTIEALHEGIWDWRITDNTLITSPSWARVLGLDPEDYRGRHALDSFNRLLPEEWKARLFQAIEHHFMHLTKDFYLEHEILRADGQRIWVASHGRVVERDESGRPRRMVGSLIDISERVVATDRIIGLMSQLDVILTLSPDGIIYFDELGQVSFVNRAFEIMTGLKAGEVTGKDWAHFLDLLAHRSDPAQAFPAVAPSGKGQAGTPALLYMLTPRRSVLQITAQLPADGESVVVYLRDVTRETEVDRMKSEFLSTAAHELRTPMTSILGFVELLRVREFDREQTGQILETIHRQARRLTDLINELLDLARIEARGGQVFRMERLSINALVRETVDGLNVADDLHQIEVSLAEGSTEIAGDPAKLHQAVLNVLSNACKYSPDGGRITVQVIRRQREGQEELGVAVQDEGIGMSAEDLARLFERFFRADRSCRIPGTGLGMSLVKEIIDAHGGQIDVQSQLGEGTQVTLWLPVACADALPAETA